MSQHYASCDENMRLLFSIGLRQLKPLPIISQIGAAFFTIHPLQSLLSAPQATAVLHAPWVGITPCPDTSTGPRNIIAGWPQ